MKKIKLLISLMLVFILYIIGAIVAMGYKLIRFIFFSPLYIWNELKAYTKSFIFPLPQKVREVIKMYDHYGLKHNSQFLDKIKYEILLWDIYEQAKYADEITVQFCVNYYIDENFIDQSMFYLDFFDISNWNATSIANLAFLALNHRDKRISTKADQLLTEIKMDYLNKNKNKD